MEGWWDGMHSNRLARIIPVILN